MLALLPQGTPYNEDSEAGNPERKSGALNAGNPTSTHETQVTGFQVKQLFD